jgi:hypothetical protein
MSNTGHEGNTQIDEDAFPDLTDGHAYSRAFEAQPPGENRDNNIGVNRKEQDPEDGVESHQAGGILFFA